MNYKAFGPKSKDSCPTKSINHALWESDFKSSTYDLSWSFDIQSLFKEIQSNTPPTWIMYESQCCIWAHAILYNLETTLDFGGVFFRVVWITSSYRQVAIARCSCKPRRSLHSNPLRWHLQAFAIQLIWTPGSTGKQRNVHILTLYPHLVLKTFYELQEHPRFWLFLRI